MLEIIFGTLAALAVPFFTIWLVGLMLAVLVACLICWVAEKIIQLVNHWRFLNWLNQLQR